MAAPRSAVLTAIETAENVAKLSEDEFLALALQKGETDQKITLT